MKLQLFVLLLFFCVYKAMESNILCVDNSCTAQMFKGQLITEYVDVVKKLHLPRSLGIDVVGKVESDQNTLLIKHKNDYFFIDHSFIERVDNEQIPELHSVASPVNMLPPSKVRFTTSSTASINKQPTPDNKPSIVDKGAPTPSEHTAAVREQALPDSAPSTTDSEAVSLEEQVNKITKEADEVMRRELEREIKEEQDRIKLIESRKSAVDEDHSEVPAVATEAVALNQEPTHQGPQTALNGSIMTEKELGIEKQKITKIIVKEMDKPVQLLKKEEGDKEITTKQAEKEDQANLAPTIKLNKENIKQTEKEKKEEMRKQIDEKTKQIKKENEEKMTQAAIAKEEGTSEGRKTLDKEKAEPAQSHKEMLEQQSKEAEQRKTPLNGQEENQSAENVAEANQNEKLSIRDQLANQVENFPSEEFEKTEENKNENIGNKSFPNPDSDNQHPQKNENTIVKEKNNEQKLHREEKAHEEEEGDREYQREKLKQDEQTSVESFPDPREVPENTESNAHSTKTGQSLHNLNIQVSEDLGSSTSSLFTEDDPNTDGNDISTSPTSSDNGFLQCLIASANVNNTPILILPPSSGKRSTLAYLCTIFIQKVFLLAEQVVSYLPSKFVATTDSLLVYTCNIPFTYLVAWTIFLLSICLQYLLIKLAFRVLLGGSGCSVVNRTLEEWLAIEENANQLADRLADQEEANARQTIWVTQLREQCTEQSARELKELKAAHDALAEHLARVKHQSSLNASHQEEQIASLSRQLHQMLEEKQLILAQDEELRQSLVNEADEEKRALLKRSDGYAARIVEMEKVVESLTESNGKLEEDLVARAREIASLRDAFIQLKIFEIALAEKKTAAEKPKISTTAEPSDGWEVEELDPEELNLQEDAPSASKGNEDQENIQKTLENFLHLGKLKAALAATEVELRSEKCKREQEAQIRTQLQEKLILVEESVADLSQKLIQSNEDKEAAVKKLEILSQYFTEREAVLQRNLGRQALTESESSEELNFLKQRTKALEEEMQTLRNQITSVRREKVEIERVSRQRISELDKRLHDDWLAARASENLIKELRDENASLRQKIGEGEKAFLNQLVSRGVSLPMPPPPRGSLGKRSVASPELRNSSLLSGVIPPPPLPPPFMTPPPGMPFLTAPDGSLLSPPTLPSGMPPFLRPFQPSNRSSPVLPGWKANSGNVHVTPNSGNSRSAKRS